MSDSILSVKRELEQTKALVQQQAKRIRYLEHRVATPQWKIDQEYLLAAQTLDNDLLRKSLSMKANPKHDVEVLDLLVKKDRVDLLETFLTLRLEFDPCSRIFGPVRPAAWGLQQRGLYSNPSSLTVLSASHKCTQICAYLLNDFRTSRTRALAANIITAADLNDAKLPDHVGELCASFVVEPLAMKEIKLAIKYLENDLSWHKSRKAMAEAQISDPFHATSLDGGLFRRSNQEAMRAMENGRNSIVEHTSEAEKVTRLISMFSGWLAKSPHFVDLTNDDVRPSPAKPRRTPFLQFGASV